MINKIAQEFTQMDNSFMIESPTTLMVLGAILIIFNNGTFNMLTYGHWALGYLISAQNTLRLVGLLEKER